MSRSKSICHPDQPNVGKGMCKRCYSLDWKHRHGTKPRAPKQIAVCHPDREYHSMGLCEYCYQKNWNSKRTPEHRTRSRLKFNFRMTLEEFENLLDKQSGLCAICRRPESRGQPLSVDHDRKCCPDVRSCGNCIRGLLCANCNTALGLFGDNSESLERAVGYIRTRNTERTD